jgi:hypothetical protein
MSYRPWASGKFLIAAGLRPLQGSVFPPMADRDVYLANKVRARSEDLAKYYPATVRLSDVELRAAVDLLRSHATAVSMDPAPPFRDAFDEFTSGVPEDIALWKRQEGKEWLGAIHLCAPNHWAAADKVGRDFPATHAPVPRMAALNKAAPSLFQQILQQGPMERMAWGVATDDRLNHHPDPPAGVDPADWHGRRFDAATPRLWARVERQTLLPVPGHELVVFTIRTEFVDLAQANREDRSLVAQCIEGMPSDVLAYKGLARDRDVVVRWLRT